MIQVFTKQLRLNRSPHRLKTWWRTRYVTPLHLPRVEQHQKLQPRHWRAQKPAPEPTWELRPELTKPKREPWELRPELTQLALDVIQQHVHIVRALGKALHLVSDYEDVDQKFLLKYFRSELRRFRDAKVALRTDRLDEGHGR